MDSAQRSIREEQEANMKNIKGYQDKGLLNILDRETTHYNTINKQPVARPPATPLKSGGPRRSGEVPPLQNAKITEDTLMESKRMAATNSTRNNKVLTSSISSPQVARPAGFGSRDGQRPQQKSPYPIQKPEDNEKLGLKAFTSVNEIQRYLDNPNLINMKAQPSRLLDT